MGTWANGHLAIWGKWAPGKMGAIIRATGHRGKWVFGAHNWANENF